MSHPAKACPFVVRAADLGLQVLALRHPLAGNQWVKGTVEPGETPYDAARRELAEESGLIAPSRMVNFATIAVGDPAATWHLFACAGSTLPNQWTHQTRDDHGHAFTFFWHPVRAKLDENWHPHFHGPFSRLQTAAAAGLWTRIERLQARPAI